MTDVNQSKAGQMKKIILISERQITKNHMAGENYLTVTASFIMLENLKMANLMEKENFIKKYQIQPKMIKTTYLYGKKELFRRGKVRAIL